MCWFLEEIYIFKVFIKFYGMKGLELYFILLLRRFKDNRLDNIKLKREWFRNNFLILNEIKK